MTSAAASAARARVHAGGVQESLDLAPSGRKGAQHPLGHPLELGHAADRWAEADAERLAEAGPERRLVDEAGRAGVGVDQAGVGGRPGAVGPLRHIGHQHVGVELGVAGPRGAMDEGGADESLRPRSGVSPPCPRRTKSARRSR